MVSNSRNKIHQTWERNLSPPVFQPGCMLAKQVRLQTKLKQVPIQENFVTIIMQHVNTDSDAVDAFKVLDESGGGAISRLVV